jgi:RNA recognition motif-containing protein
MASCRLFVTKVPRDSNDGELIRYFGNFGELADVHLPKIPGQPGHKGIAFVSYKDPDCAKAVLHMSPHSIRGNIMIVDVATPAQPSGKGAQKSSWDSWGHDQWGAKGDQWGASTKGDHWGASTTKGGSDYSEYWNKPASRSISETSTEASMSRSGSNGSESGDDFWDSLFESVLGGGQTEQPRKESMDYYSTVDSNEGWTPATHQNSNSSSWSSDWSLGGGKMNSKGGASKGGALERTDSWGVPVGKGPHSTPYGSSIGVSNHLKSVDAEGRKVEYAEEGTKIFVTKIPSSINREHIFAYFNQFGDLADCYVPAHPTGKFVHKGIAFITFRDAKHVDEVLARQQYEITPGTFIVVDKAKSRPALF